VARSAGGRWHRRRRRRGRGAGLSGPSGNDAAAAARESAARSDHIGDLDVNIPRDATFSTVMTFAGGTEGLTADAAGRLYTAERSFSPAQPCTVYRVDLGTSPPSKVAVDTIPGNPGGVGTSGGSGNPTGVAFDRAGCLYIGDPGIQPPAAGAPPGRIWRLLPDDANPPTAQIYAEGTNGANGIAFDRRGNLWVTEGANVGSWSRIWKISPQHNPGDAVAAGDEMFRVQPMRNGTALLGGNVAGEGVGRQNRRFPTGALANSTAGPQIVANGIAFNAEGDLFIADTDRGAIWRVPFDDDGNPILKMGCDATFAPDTLCLGHVFVQHPLLNGADGIALDRAGNIWVACNERNAIVVVTADGRVAEVFRNPPVTCSDGRPLRNAGPLEFPTSPFIVGRRFYVAQFESPTNPVGDDGLPEAGELQHGLGAGTLHGKISVLDPDLVIRGLPLPVR
jgi:sugar lactone lactonase YvrE